MNLQNECQRIVAQINALGGDLALVEDEGPLPPEMVGYLNAQLEVYREFPAEDAARIWMLASDFTELRLAEMPQEEKVKHTAFLAIRAAVLMRGRMQIVNRAGEEVPIKGIVPRVSNAQIAAMAQGESPAQTH